MSWRRSVAAWAGPALIVVLVLFALRGFVLEARLTNEHSDLLSFWLPRWTHLGRSIAAGQLPVWNPFEMLGYRFAADPQGGWLYAPPMLLFSTLSPSVAMRAILVGNPLLASLGLYAFLRIEGIGRLAATAGGVSLAAMMTTSETVLSMPFAGSLAWTSVTLIGAAGFRRATRWSRRLAWLGLGAFGWSQVASAHLSHGLVMCTVLVGTYLLAHAILDARGGRVQGRVAAARVALFVVALPLASLAIIVPRADLIGSSALREGYTALEGGGIPTVEVGDRALQTNGVWAAWPLALSSAPGAYAGAAVLLALPLALRTRQRRALLWGAGAAFLVVYDLMLDAVVTGRTGELIASLPFGDTLIHNPGRLRFTALFVAPILAAVGIQGLRDEPLSPRRLAPWLAAGVALWLVLPLVAGGTPVHWILFAVAAVPAVIALVAWSRSARWAPVLLVAFLALEVVASSLVSSRYTGFTMFLGLEGGSSPNAVPQPLRAPEIDLDAFLAPTAFVPLLGADRYLTWAPPAAWYQRGYLAAQEPSDWPALALQRGTLFERRDVLGYNPVQMARYWTWIRVANDLPLFYNATSIQLPTRRDVDLMGVRFLIVPEGVPSPVPGRVTATADGYDLVEVDDPPPMASVLADWVWVKSTDDAFTAVRWEGFAPQQLAMVEGRPGIQRQQGGQPGEATYREVSPTEVHVEVVAPAPSIVLIRNSYDEGWSATVDGEPAPVLPTDGFLQGVPVRAGTHEIRLVYHDRAVELGLWLGAAVWAALLAAFLIVLRTERRRSGRPESEVDPGPGDLHGGDEPAPAVV